MGINRNPDDSFSFEQEPSFFSKIGVIFALLVGFAILTSGAYLADLQQRKLDDFIGRKVLIKYNQIEGVIIRSPYDFLNESHWEVEYVDKIGNRQYAYCLSNEIELQEQE